MVRKLIFVGVVAIGGVLPFAVSSPGSTRQTPVCFGSPATITGSGTIEGTGGDDVIVGSDGDDVIHGRDGNDKLCGGPGNDEIGGGPGDDQVDGGPGNDVLAGGLGNDTVLGGEGDDKIECGTGDDVADSGPGSNAAVTTGFEACETVTNAGGAATAAVPKPLAARLTAAQPVPRSQGARRATGLFSVTLTTTGSGATVVWRLTFTRLSGPASVAHIHRGEAGDIGPILARLCSPCRTGARGTAIVEGQPARSALNNGLTYVDVHTKRNPAGEIRGQIFKVGG